MKRQMLFSMLVLFAYGLIPVSSIYSQVGVLEYTRDLKMSGKVVTLTRRRISDGAEAILTVKDSELAARAVESAKRIVLIAAAEQGVAISAQELISAAQQITSDIVKERTILLEATRKITLTSAPNISPNASGKILYFENFQSAFSGEIELRGLIPSHSYFLSLNGKPPHPSNEWLPEVFGGEERYFDFAQISTDSAGNVHERFRVDLKPGAYNVKLLVKDIEDWRVVLYNSILILTIVP